MNTSPTFIQRNGRKFVALAAVASLYVAGQLPRLSDSQMTELAANYRFSVQPLPDMPGHAHRMVRAVHPSLDHICAWISSVGAGVALNDLDNDGLPNDLCHVDPRTDLVVVSPAPGTPQRYKPFILNPSPLPYDASTMAPMGTVPGDFNEDGFMDILAYYWGRTPVLFLRKETNDTTSVPLAADSYVATEVAPKVERWFTNCAAVADLDADGHLDLIVGNYFPDGANILDANGTGIEEMQHSMSKAFNGGSKRLLLWAGGTSGQYPTVRFNDASSALSSDISRGWTLALGAADLDGDLRPELYFANDFGPDRLLHNRSTPGKLAFQLLQGTKRLTDPRSKVLGDDSFKGMGVDFADLNRDGILDIYVSNIAAEYALEESHFVWMSNGQLDRMRDGVAPYHDESEPLGLSRSSWGWESRFGDFNNDGVNEAVQATGFAKGTRNRWPELHELATSNDELLSDPRAWLECRPGDDLCGHHPNPFFAWHESGRYFDISKALGIDRPMVSRGIATADVDGDGLLDFAVANQWDTSFFYHNQAPKHGEFIGLHLLMPYGIEWKKTTVWDGHPHPGYRALRAVGASATIHLPNGEKIVAQVDGGNGHSGKRSHDLHFGIGNLPKDTPIKAELEWRDSQGVPRRALVTLKPGWHTIMLGQS